MFAHFNTSTPIRTSRDLQMTHTIYIKTTGYEKCWSSGELCGFLTRSSD